MLNYQGSIHVRELDWMGSWPPSTSSGNSTCHKRLIDILFNSHCSFLSVKRVFPHFIVIIFDSDILYEKHCIFFNGDNSSSWTSSNVEEAERAAVLVAADVIYSDDLTDALFCILEKLMSLGPKKVCINKGEQH